MAEPRSNGVVELLLVAAAAGEPMELRAEVHTESIVASEPNLFSGALK